jgi:hypothetical protein
MRISKQETIMETYIKDGVADYIITRNSLGKYILYKVKEDDYEKLKTAETPVGFQGIIEKNRGK